MLILEVRQTWPSQGPGTGLPLTASPAWLDLGGLWQLAPCWARRRERRRKEKREGGFSLLCWAAARRGMLTSRERFASSSKAPQQ